MSTLIEDPLLALSAESSARLPALAEHVDQLACPPASAVVITHILDTALPFIEAISRAVDLVAVIGIPYSTMPTARRQLEAAGHRVVIPPDIESLPALAREEIERASALREEPVIVQEIGGYCAPFAEELWEAGLIAGIVEDTKQGHWRYAERGNLPCPVLSIAESPLKALEDQQVGRSISHALETILRRQFHRLLTETKVGILGYGGIGEATAVALSSLGARVAVFDQCGIRMAKAALDGFGETSREELIRKSDVVLGVSGHRSIEGKDLELLRPGTILASGSSKQVEIDLGALNLMAVEKSEPGLVQHFTLSEGKQVFLLNEGMPINFLEQSILGRVLDLVYTELFLCMREIALGNVGPGLQSLDIDQHRMAAQKWHRLHWV
ncbi:MAG TPA: NAD(P)-dependent oxidoreductase [Solirubrobacterales bacterium]|nr:NAD(P)-dependent oxidoreductase [Solirubrobacterales bacterium]